MSTTQLQRDAMQRAQRGDWSLADAIEVLSYAGQEDAGFRKFSGGLRQGGRLRFLSWGGATDCTNCDGTGEVTETCDSCQHESEVECEACDGLGSVSSQDGEVTTDLDGRPVDLETLAPGLNRDGSSGISIASATATLAAYHKALTDAAAPAAVIAPTPNTTQIPLIQENAPCA